MLDVLKKRLNQLKEVAKPLSEEERNARYDICKSCEHLIELTSTCKKCGCFMQAKTYIAAAECPIGKWGAVVREKKD